MTPEQLLSGAITVLSGAVVHLYFQVSGLREKLGKALGELEVFKRCPVQVCPFRFNHKQEDQKVA